MEDPPHFTIREDLTDDDLLGLFSWLREIIEPRGGGDLQYFTDEEMLVRWHKGLYGKYIWFRDVPKGARHAMYGKLKWG